MRALLCVAVQTFASLPTPAQEDGHAVVPGESETAEVAVPLQGRAALARAATYYESGRYANCIDAFQALLEEGSPTQLGDPRAVLEARVYLAACHIARGELEEADRQFQDAIRANPQMPPPEPVLFPEAVVDRFFMVRGGMLKEIRAAEEARLAEAKRAAQHVQKLRDRERARVQTLEQLAAEDRVVQRNRRWIAAVPFGVGQFQNGDDLLGWIFFGTEMGALGAVVVGTSIELGLNSRANRPGAKPLDPHDLTRSSTLARHTHQVGLVALTGLGLAGIVEAQLSFRPELPLERKQRELPPHLRPTIVSARRAWWPSIEPQRGGVSLGLTGHF